MLLLLLLQRKQRQSTLARPGHLAMTLLQVPPGPDGQEVAAAAGGGLSMAPDLSPCSAGLSNSRNPLSSFTTPEQDRYAYVYTFMPTIMHSLSNRAIANMQKLLVSNDYFFPPFFPALEIFSGTRQWWRQALQPPPPPRPMLKSKRIPSSGRVGKGVMKLLPLSLAGTKEGWLRPFGL